MKFKNLSSPNNLLFYSGHELFIFKNILQFKQNETCLFFFREKNDGLIWDFSNATMN
jgi:hypothetical protein